VGVIPCVSFGWAVPEHHPQHSAAPCSQSWAPLKKFQRPSFRFHQTRRGTLARHPLGFTVGSRGVGPDSTFISRFISSAPARGSLLVWTKQVLAPQRKTHRFDTLAASPLLPSHSRFRYQPCLPAAPRCCGRSVARIDPNTATSPLSCTSLTT
jgi:hypothetical protein